jgi:hypothetical protein
MSQDGRRRSLFLSYSHDSTQHVEYVSDLARQLERLGFNVLVDQAVSAPPEGWAVWSERSMNGADWVLLIVTKEYRKRLEGLGEVHAGRGTAWEGHLIRGEIYGKKGKNDRFVCVIPPGGDPADIPAWLSQSTYYELPASLGELVALLSDGRARGFSVAGVAESRRSGPVEGRRWRLPIGLAAAIFVGTATIAALVFVPPSKSRAPESHSRDAGGSLVPALGRPAVGEREERSPDGPLKERGHSRKRPPCADGVAEGSIRSVLQEIKYRNTRGRVTVVVSVTASQVVVRSGLSGQQQAEFELEVGRGIIRPANCEPTVVTVTENL